MITPKFKPGPPPMKWFTAEEWDSLPVPERALQWARYFCDVLHVQEYPHGSNKGPEIDEFARLCGFPNSGEPWCAMVVSYCLHLSGWNKFKNASVWAWWFDAVKAGAVKEVNIPRRGDLFLNIKAGHTHMGFVTAEHAPHFTSLAGNTNDDGSREGYEMCRKELRLSPYKFLRIV